MPQMNLRRLLLIINEYITKLLGLQNAFILTINSENKSRVMWNVINNEIGQSRDTIKQNLFLFKNDELISNPQTISDMFMTQFSFVPEVNNCIPVENPFRFINRNPHTLLYPVSPQEIKDTIASVKSKFS
jgi:hypothetical protein